MLVLQSFACLQKKGRKKAEINPFGRTQADSLARIKIVALFTENDLKLDKSKMQTNHFIM